MLRQVKILSIQKRAFDFTNLIQDRRAWCAFKNGKFSSFTVGNVFFLKFGYIVRINLAVTFQDGELTFRTTANRYYFYNDNRQISSIKINLSIDGKG